MSCLGNVKELFDKVFGTEQIDSGSYKELRAEHIKCFPTVQTSGPTNLMLLIICLVDNEFLTL